MRKCFVKERGFKHWLLMGAALATRSVINFKELGRSVSRKFHAVVIEDLLGEVLWRTDSRFVQNPVKYFVIK